MKDLKTPKTRLQEILYTFIQNGKISLFDFPYLPSFRSRISNLKLNCDVLFTTKNVTRKNKFNNSYTYVEYILTDVKQAKNKYKELTKSKDK